MLASAVAGPCRCMVTGDDDLLALKQYAGIAIMAPAAFAEYETQALGAG